MLYVLYTTREGASIGNVGGEAPDRPISRSNSRTPPQGVFAPPYPTTSKGKTSTGDARTLRAPLTDDCGHRRKTGADYARLLQAIALDSRAKPSLAKPKRAQQGAQAFVPTLHKGAAVIRRALHGGRTTPAGVAARARRGASVTPRDPRKKADHNHSPKRVKGRRPLQGGGRSVGAPPQWGVRRRRKRRGTLRSPCPSPLTSHKGPPAGMIGRRPFMCQDYSALSLF